MNLVDFAQHYFDSHEFGIKENSQRCYYLPAVVSSSRRPIVSRSKQSTKVTQISLWIGCDRGPSQLPLNTPGGELSRPSGVLLTMRANAQYSSHFAKFALLRNPLEHGLARTVRNCSIPPCSINPSGLGESKSGTYWGSLFSAAWDSGLRLGDLLSIELDGSFAIASQVLRLSYSQRVKLAKSTSLHLTHQRCSSLTKASNSIRIAN